MKINTGAITLFSLLLCTHASFALNIQAQDVQADSLEIMNVKSGERFEIQLPANRTTGYSWYMDPFEERTLEFVRSEYKTTPNKRGLVGRGGIRTFVFKALGKPSEKAHLSFLYASPSRTTIAKTKTYQILINT